MTPPEARILTLLEIASHALNQAYIASEPGCIGPFRHRIHALALDVRRLHLDGFGEISKPERKKPRRKKR